MVCTSGFVNNVIGLGYAVIGQTVLSTVHPSVYSESSLAGITGVCPTHIQRDHATLSIAIGCVYAMRACDAA